MVNYALGSNSYFLWGEETTPFTVAPSIGKNFGLIADDVSPPNPNKKTPLPTIGSRRAPHTWADDPKELAFDIPFHVQHADAPFHVALGQKVVTSIPDSGGGAPGGDQYTKTLFTEASILPTITVEHGSVDLNILQQFIGVKASLGLTTQKGESLKANLGLTPTKETHNATNPTFQTPSLPTNEPFRFSHIQYAKLFAGGTVGGARTLVKDLTTVDSFDFNWNPSLEQVFHGGSGREGHITVEGDPAGLYDMKIGITDADSDVFTRAADDSALVDLEVALARKVAATTNVLQDALIVRLINCTILDAPVPAPSAGRIKSDVPLGPLNTQIEIRTPA